MIRFVAKCLGVVLVILALLSAQPKCVLAREAVVIQSLADVYTQAVRDTNGDGLADDVVARVIVPTHPSLGDVQAAANIAGRLGYETTAATLPVTITDDATVKALSGMLPILVGRGNHFVEELIARGRLNLDALAPGQGLVELVPNAVGGQTVLVVAGKDEAGTLAASQQVAARLPRLWNMSGISMKGIEQQTRDYLRTQDIRVENVSVDSLVVDHSRRGLFDLRLRVEAHEGDTRKVVQAFERIDEAHRFGRDTNILDFAAVRTTTVAVVDESGSSERVTIRRTGPNWRALVALPRSPAPLTAEQLVTAARSPTAAVPPKRRPACVGCPLYMVDGMIPGGGGGFYSAATPAQPAAEKLFDLAEVFTINGWFGDHYRDLLPDSTDTQIILGGQPRESLGAAHIAARLGLESTGITLPLARGEESVRNPGNEPSPILVGRENGLVQALVQADKMELDGLRPGEGMIQIVPNAYGSATATVVAGADARGSDAASLYLARRVPYVWDTRPGALTLDDIKTHVSDFLAGRTAAGQAARAINVLEGMLDKRKSAPLDALEVKLYLDDIDEPFARHLEERLTHLTGARAPSVKIQAQRSPVVALKERMDVPWEGKEFRSRLRDELIPKIQAGDTVELNAWLSEEPSVRQRLAAEAIAELKAAGAAKVHVQLLSAYKQGLFWLTEQVLPELRSVDVASVHIKVRAASPEPASGARVGQYPARWVKALYPSDEIFSREIGLSRESFHIEQVDEQDVVYRLEAKDKNDRVVYAASFTPHLFERPYLEDMSGAGSVQVETGHFSARINGHALIEARIETDMERLRDAFVKDILPKVREYVLSASGGQPSPEKAPYFRDLRIDVQASELDYDYGVKAEHMSSAEALAAELSNVTNSVLGAVGAPSSGRVIPFVSVRAGQDSHATISLTRNAAAAPRVDVTYRRRGEDEPTTVSHELSDDTAVEFKVMRVVAVADGLNSLGIEARFPDGEKASRAIEMLQTLEGFHKAGLFKEDLSYERVGALEVTVLGAEQRQTVAVAYGGSSRTSGVHTSSTRPASGLVKWDHVIGPAESEMIIGKLAYYPGVAAYRKARSYEGRDISVLEITAPAAGELVSMAKLSAYKPTAMIVGRQHGNEPSSTSFILGMAEHLASDPQLMDIAREVNVVLLPVMNPDGAALAEEIRERRPMDVASPGYLSAIAQDVTVSAKLPESVVDPYLWRRWLPDIYLNAHGATSHELPQPLNNQVSPQAPTYAFRRGWYSLAFRVPRDPRYRDWEEAALALRDVMSREIGADPRNRQGNREDYDRFARWGHRLAPHMEPLEIHDDAMLFYSDQSSGDLLGIWRFPPPPPSTPEENRNARIGDWPTVTLDGGTFEAADEGASGELLALAIRNGYAAVLAHLKYLRDGQRDLQRIEEDAPGDGSRLTTVRVRPVMPHTDTTSR